MSDTNFFKIEHNRLTPEQGKILIAEPFADDFYFKRSVVLLTEHNDHGSMGFILNNFSLKLPIASILNDLSHFKGQLSIGGPVNTDSLFYMHTFGKEIEGSIPIMDNLFWGGDFEEIKNKIELGLANNTNLRFFLGYSGWSEGQLENELNSDYWLVSDISVNEVMNVKGNNELWQSVLQRMGKKYELWSKFPENPQLN
jgi:putative transcriptional regulator